MLVVLLGCSCQVVSSDDPGASSQLVNRDPREAQLILQNQFAIDLTHFIAIAENRKLVKSDDAGATWSLIGDLSNSADLSDLLEMHFDIYFITPEHGWLLGNEKTFETTDGGKTWGRLFDKGVFSIFFVDSKSGWMNLGDTNVVTADGGISWRSCGSKQAFVFMGPVSFIDRRGWAIVEEGNQKSIVMTVDGGCAWKKIYDLPKDPDTRYTDIFFQDAMTGWYSTQTENAIFRTTNGGSNWSRIGLPSAQAELEAFSFRGEEGWVLFASEPEKIIFYATKDGGTTWFHGDANDFRRAYTSGVSFPRLTAGLRAAWVIQNAARAHSATLPRAGSSRWRDPVAYLNSACPR
ncbi:MAG: hypothetical protein LC113_13055 [Acidobacteria bacterium]|nr:hypothetical protein [Acidobacteriota bacterium]